MSQEVGGDAVALTLRDVARLVGRVRLVPTERGLSPAISHADLWRSAPGLIRRLVHLSDTGRLDLSETGCHAEALLDAANMIELYPHPADAK